MEIDITAFVLAHGDSMERFSDSIANSGMQNIGAVTWRNACAAMADESAWLTDDLEALRDHFADYGAWERHELAAMSGAELNALLVQFIAGDWQGRADAEERGDLAHWEECDGGRLFQGDIPGGDGFGRWFYYVGS